MIADGCKKGTPIFCQSACDGIGKLFRAEDGVFGGFGHAEFDHLFRRDLNGRAAWPGCGQRGPQVDQHQLANAGER